MTDFDAPRALLMRLSNDSGDDLATLSRYLERNHAYLQQYVMRGSPRELPEEMREKLGQRFGVSPDMFRSKSRTARPAKDSAAKREVRGDQSEIAEYDITPHAGPGALPVYCSEEDGLKSIGNWALPTQFLRAFTENVNSLAIVRVSGDSMEPDYRAGDRVMVDTSHRIPSPAGVYVLWDGFGLVLKRLEIIPGTSDPVMIHIMSINPGYPSYDRAMNEITINGRVIGRWDWK